MKCPRPRPVELLDDEKELFARTTVDSLEPDFHEKLRSAYAAVGSLARSLLERAAIPRIRLEYFNNPDYNIGCSRSRRQVFEDNGTYGEAILRHANFLRYFKYFIEGPDLDPETVEGFCQLVDCDEELPTLRAYARAQVRRHKWDGRSKSEEFYKLALECELNEWEARTIRDAVRSIRA